MRRTGLAAVCFATFGVIGCSAEEPALVGMLVDTFDVPSCFDAQWRYAGRKEIGETEFHERRYEASDQCMNDLVDSAESLGFSQVRLGVWSGEVVDGTAEYLKIMSDEDSTTGNLVWEIEVR